MVLDTIAKGTLSGTARPFTGRALGLAACLLR